MIAINSFDPWTLVLLAALNPAIIAVAFWMGRQADQASKVLIAGFAASCAGFLLYWLGGQVGVFAIHAIGGEAALFVIGFFFGLAWAALGYYLRKR
jgi:hypothetical protein